MDSLVFLITTPLKEVPHFCVSVFLKNHHPIPYAQKNEKSRPCYQGAPTLTKTALVLKPYQCPPTYSRPSAVTEKSPIIGTTQRKIPSRSGSIEGGAYEAATFPITSFHFDQNATFHISLMKINMSRNIHIMNYFVC